MIDIVREDLIFTKKVSLTTKPSLQEKFKERNILISSFESRMEK